MSNSKSSGNSGKSRGYAFTFEAAMALLLVLGFLGIAMIYPQQKESYTSIIESKELVSDTQRALDENGFTVTILDKDLNELDNSGKMAALYTMLKSELPATLDIHLSLKKFESNADDNGCLLDKNFEKCFPDSVTFPEWGSTVPGDREVVGNTFFLVKKSSPGQCDILGMLAAGKEKSKESLLAFFDGPTAYFADANDLNIFFTTTVTPATEAECDQDITVDLNATIPPIGRSPASVMLLVDRSGSTDTYDMKIKTTIGTTSNGTCNGGACHATCYLSNKNTEYDSFTSKQDVATINLTQSTINRIDAGKKIFARVWPDEYTGTCDALGSMVLWVQRPDGVVEKDSGLNYEEDLPASPAAGNYHALLWDDTATPDSYSAIYLGQEPTNNSIYNASFTFPSSVSSYGNIGSAIAVPANTTFALKFHFTYSGYSGASQPRLRINRSGSYYPSYPGYVNCGTAGASSGSCDITVIDNDATGGYAASGNYQVQGRMASGSAATFNLTATHQMENIIYQTETPASNSMYDGSLSFTSTYQSITGTSITVPSNKTFKLIYYFTYSGNSGGKQVWFNISKPGSDVAFNCGTAPSGSCNITVVDNAPSGSYTQNGTYTVQRKVNSGTATINTTITYDMESCTASYCDPVNYGPGTIGNKTCDSSSCVNCPHGTGLTGTSTATNVQTADNFSIGADTVMEHYRGIYADIKNISVDPTAVCTAGIGFQNPIEGSNKNFYFSFPPSSNFCYEISQTGMQTCTNDHIHTTVPLASGDYNVLAWSDKSISYTIDWQEQRIDAAKTSAKTFLNNALWKPADRFGLTWFAGDSSFQGQSMTANKDSVKTALNNLAPSGNTPMALGIATARQGLNSEPAENMKFLILLTDGLANVRYPNTLYGCSGSGFDNTQDWYCVSDAIAQANQARANGVSVFVIGVADQTVFQETVEGSSPLQTYENALKQLAKDQDDPRYAAQCMDASGNPIPEAHCGKYYYAGDLTQLEGIYALIAQDIGDILAEGQAKAYGANVAIELPKSAVVSDPGTGNWIPGADPNFINYSIGDMNAAAPWLDHFVMHIPCNSDTACATTSIKVPDDNSYFTYYKDQNHAGGEKAIRWDGNTILFKYRDLQVNILAGRIFGSNRMVLDLNAANKGTLDSNVATTVALYWSSDSNSLDDPLGSLSVPPLLPGQAQAYYDVNIAKAGWIIAIINPDPPHNINECPQGNIAKIKCTSGTKVEYYQLKVQVWRR